MKELEPETSQILEDARLQRHTMQQNPIVKWFRILRPQLWDAPDFEKVAAVISYACHLPMSKIVRVEEVCEALADLLPEQREFWLRVDATHNIRFVESMTAMFEADPECIT